MTASEPIHFALMAYRVGVWVGSAACKAEDSPIVTATVREIDRRQISYPPGLTGYWATTTCPACLERRAKLPRTEAAELDAHPLTFPDVSDV
jgi:hypothetical protein